MHLPRHLYIHVPFCQRRCSYCDFNTYANLEHRIEAYVAALCTELRAQRQNTRHSSLVTRHSTDSLTRASLQPSIFLGGGTPTMLTLNQMEQILLAADELVPLGEAEVTTEANPGTVIDEAYLRGLRSLGINRISFGVQTLHDPTLRVLGRIHTAAEAIATVEQARRAGFERINVDFIFGLPGQTEEQWALTLDRVAQLDVDHLSLYSLILEEGTPLHQQVTRGSITVPDDDVTAGMYELAMEKLAAAGFIQYEISNWARDDQGLGVRGQGSATTDVNLDLIHNSTFITHNSEPALPSQACHHNLAYWLNADYLACGAGAHGHFYPRRWHNILGVDAYIAAINEHGSAVVETVELSPGDLRAETMMMGLRLNAGVSYAHFAERCGTDLAEAYGSVLPDLVRDGLLIADSAGVRLTERGRMFGNEVFLRFLDPVPLVA